MAEIKDLSTTDASNTGRFPENQNPSTVNDGARALEGMLARHNFDTVEGNLNSTGSANAYLVAANRTIAAYFDGMRQCFHANFANTGAATLNIDSVGAKTIKKNHDQDLASGDIEQHQFVEVVYSASDDTFQMISPVANAPLAATGDQTITSTDAGAAEGPTLSLHRDSAAPADADILGAVLFKGEDDGSNATTYAAVQAVADDVTDATEDGTLNLQTMVAGTLATRAAVKAGIVVGSATGGDQGAGTINATAIYDDGVQLTQGTILTVGTADATLSGTTGALFSDLPANIKRVLITFSAISLDDTDNFLVQIGDSGGLHTTGYVSGAKRDGSAVTSTAGFIIAAGDAAHQHSGHMTLTNITGNIWVASHATCDQASAANMSVGGGSVTLDSALTQIALLDTAGDNFDGGTINIMYEV